MLRRSDNNAWCFPGGGVEPGETLEAAAMREVFEETGLAVTGLQIFGAFSGPQLHYVYPNQDEVHIVDIVYTCSDYAGNITLDDEGREAEFFPVDCIPDELSPPVVPVVRELQQRYLQVQEHRS